MHERRTLCGSGLGTMFPIVGATASVRDRHDVDIVLTNPVHDVVREPVHTQLAARSSRRSRHADLGMCSNQVDRFGNCVEEFAAEARALLLVPPDRVGQFGGGRIADLKRLHRPSKSFSIRRFTCSQGSRRIVPASIASIRRSISSFQAASASGSAGPSRLAKSSAASSARAAESNRSASANTAWAPLVMQRFYASSAVRNNDAASALGIFDAGGHRRQVNVRRPASCGIEALRPIDAESRPTLVCQSSAGGMRNSRLTA
jgi:hypothetical protein